MKNERYRRMPGGSGNASFVWRRRILPKKNAIVMLALRLEISEVHTYLAGGTRRGGARLRGQRRVGAAAPLEHKASPRLSASCEPQCVERLRLCRQQRDAGHVLGASGGGSAPGALGQAARAKGSP